MKASELRIGNFIMSGNNGIFYAEGSIGRVLEIGNEDREFEQIYCECDESFDWFFKDNYFGIPLTNDWLLRFGFSSYEYKAGYIGKDFQSGQMTLSFVLCNPFAKGDWNDCYTFDLRDSMFKSLRYVHELQNLYFLLTNSELQFTS